MNITKITKTTPACFGVGCPVHYRCERYYLVDMAPAWQIRIGICEGFGIGQFPLFLERKDGNK